ncbi:MAG: DNA gyrase/topoisomerase IV subunit A [Opitutales bacterium]
MKQFDPTLIDPADVLGSNLREWFVDYASYVATDRAIPHLADGLKPVQRRILHVMHGMEDGRYNKNAAIIGETTKYHPHGDASIRDALVQLGQKELVIDPQGNWGNIYTGHDAAAPRYIEGRLTAFAKEVVFNPALTEWQNTYDGRKREPVALPTKFPLLLAQGAEGIGVGLSCKILPHNFNEIVDAMIAALREKPFSLLPDFATGGLADASNYNDGQSGGRVRVRSHIEIGKHGRSNALIIRSVPYGVNTTSLKESIVQASQKGKVQIEHLEDNTAAEVCIVAKLPSGTDPEQMRDAFYAFTKCEQSVAVYACVLDHEEPRYVSVSEIVQRAAAQAEDILKRELELELDKLRGQELSAILEKIFIENRIYRKIEGCGSDEEIRSTVQRAMKPHIKDFLKELSEEQMHKLLQIPVRRISRFDAEKTDTLIAKLQERIAEILGTLENLRAHTIQYLRSLKTRFGKDFPRRTELQEFSAINKQEVAIASETLQLDREKGFAGYALRGADLEEIGKCSPMDDMLTIQRNGVLKVQKVDAKVFVGTDPWVCRLFDRSDDTVYTVLYTDAESGRTFLKRFQIGGVTRDKDYPVGGEGSTVLWVGAHAPDTPEKKLPTLAVRLAKTTRQKQGMIEVKVADYSIKNRGARGNVVTKARVKAVRLA